jgi:hypothetical protein
METSLHRALKQLYAKDPEHTEVRIGGFRIDAVDHEQLVEIQHGSLGAIREKIGKLIAEHRVLVVKPIVARKTLVRLDAPGGEVISRRLSPKQGRLLDLFDDLVHFTRVFPHRRLVLEAVMVEVEEWRYPGHGRRRRWHKRDYQIDDQKLIGVQSRHSLATAADLCRLLPADLPQPFHTGHLSELLGIPRRQSQCIAYCLRHCGAVREAGKLGNKRLYAKRRFRTAACNPTSSAVS